MFELTHQAKLYVILEKHVDNKYTIRNNIENEQWIQRINSQPTSMIMIEKPFSLFVLGLDKEKAMYDKSI